MPKIKSLHDLYVSQLKDLYYAEKQLTKALPKMAKASQNPQLAKDFLKHLDETEIHVERLESVFEMLGLVPRAEKCEAISGIIEEAEELMSDSKDGAANDAALIMAAQKAEHYEITTYGSLIVFAQTLGYEKQAAVMKKTIAEEKAADEKLSQLAETSANESANVSEKERRAA